MGTKKLFRILAQVIVIAMISATLLTACGQTDKTGKSGESSSQAVDRSASTAPVQEENTQAALDPYELVYYYPGTVQPDLQAVQDELNKLLTEKINATIKLNCVDIGQYSDKMNILLATGDKVDLCFTSNWINVYTEQVGKGAYLALEELLSRYGAAIKEQVPESWWSAPMIKGKIYAVPNMQYAATSQGFYIRKDLAEKYALDTSTLKTFLDIEPFLDTVKTNENDVIPFEMYKASGLGGTQLLLPFGYLPVASYGVVDLNGDQYKVLSYHKLQVLADAYKAVRRWYINGYVSKDVATKNDTEVEKKANKYAVVPAMSCAPYGEYDYNTKYGTDMIMVPVGGAIMDTGSITATMQAIPKSSGNPERAMMFLNLLFADQKIYTTMCNGIENVHYTKVSDNIIKISQDSKYNTGMEWAFGNVFNGFLKYGDPADKLQKQKDGNDMAVASPLLGFSFDASPVKSELAQLNSACGEFIGGLSTGTLDPDVYLPKMIDKLEKAGLDKLLAEAQKQIDEWRAANGK